MGVGVLPDYVFIIDTTDSGAEDASVLSLFPRMDELACEVYLSACGVVCRDVFALR